MTEESEQPRGSGGDGGDDDPDQPAPAETAIDGGEVDSADGAVTDRADADGASTDSADGADTNGADGADTNGADGADTNGADAVDTNGADAVDSPSRFDRLERHPTPGPHNSLQSWTAYRSPLVVAVNYAVVWLVRISPSLRLKNWLLRRIGVTVGEGVSWGLEATPDVFWPERITLGDDVIVGYDSVILCHEFLQDEYRLGDVTIGDRVMIGTKAVVLPGVEIGDDAQVAANSLVADDVPPGVTVAGIPAEPVDHE